MSKHLRSYIRILIKELWSKNKVTLGSPTSKEFFKSQSRTLYGYGSRKKIKIGDRLKDLISALNKKGNSVIADALKNHKNNISKMKIFKEKTIFDALKKNYPKSYKIFYFMNYFFSDVAQFDKSDSFSKKDVERLLSSEKIQIKQLLNNKTIDLDDLNKFKIYIENNDDKIDYSQEDSLSKILEIIYQLNKIVGVSSQRPNPSSTQSVQPTATPPQSGSTSTSQFASNATSTGAPGSFNYSYTPSK